MKKLQRIRNDKQDLICDNPECQTLINKGDFAVVQYKNKYFGGNKYFHDNEKCVPK